MPVEKQFRLLKLVAILAVTLLLLPLALWLVDAVRVGHCVKRLLSDNPDIRKAAEAEVLKNGVPRPVMVAMISQGREREADRQRIARAIREMGEPAVSALSELLKIYSGSVRGLFQRSYGTQLDAARTLGDVGSPASVKPLLWLLVDLEFTWKHNATINGLHDEAWHAIVKTGANAVEPLLEVRENASMGGDIIACTWAYSLLEDIAEAGTVAPIVEGLWSADKETQCRAASVITRVSSPQALAGIEHALQGAQGERKYLLANLLVVSFAEGAKEVLERFGATEAVKDALRRYKEILHTSPDSNTQLLRFLMARYGSLEMAQEYVRSRNPLLRDSALKWAKKNGVRESQLTLGDQKEIEASGT